MTEYNPSSEDLSKYQTAAEDLSELKHMDTWSDPEWRPDQIVRTDILHFGDEGYLLKNVFTPAECQYYINRAEELGFDEIPEATKSYRDCKRVIVDSDDLSCLLMERICRYLDNIEIQGDPHDIHIHGSQALLQGTWRPLKPNNVVRLCRYYPAGHFAPHFDGHLVLSDSVRSMKTLMLYLDGEFEGGTTNFVDENQTLYMNDDGKYCAEEKNVLYRIKPQPGMAVIFNHHRLHEGEALKSGVKHIMRTDIMYERVSGPDIDPKEAEALRLAQEAERLEARGDCMAAMEMYRKAFKMSNSVASSYGCPP